MTQPQPANSPEIARPSKETAKLYVAIAFGVFMATLVNTGSVALAAALGVIAITFLMGLLFGTWGRLWAQSQPYRASLVVALRRKFTADTPQIIDFLEIHLGYETATGKDVIATLEEIGDMLIVGMKGSGKTSLVHNLIHSFIQHPKNLLRLVILDQKDGLDFRIYWLAHNLLYPITENAEQSVGTLRALAQEMERRATIFKAMPRDRMCGNLTEYHALRQEMIGKSGVDSSLFPELPRIVVIIDEFHLLKDTEDGFSLIKRIIKIGRAYGVHLFNVTQYPKVDDIPSDISSQHASKIVGWMANKRDYYGVAQIASEWYEGFHKLKIVGRFISSVGGKMFYLTSNFIPRNELERMARQCSSDHPPESPLTASAEQPKETQVPWTGKGLTVQQKETLLRNYILELGRQPSKEEFMNWAKASDRTYYSWVPRVYLQLIQEGALSPQEINS